MNKKKNNKNLEKHSYRSELLVFSFSISTAIVRAQGRRSRQRTGSGRSGLARVVYVYYVTHMANLKKIFPQV